MVKKKSLFVKRPPNAIENLADDPELNKSKTERKPNRDRISSQQYKLSCNDSSELTKSLISANK